MKMNWRGSLRKIKSLKNRNPKSGGGEPIEDWLEELAKGDEWSTALVEAINVRAVKDYRHYRWLQRELYETHCENLSAERDAIKKAEKELQKHAREYHKKVVKAEKEFKKADKKYSNACVQVSEVRQYFLGEPWGNIDGKWVMKQIDDQIELDYERMHNHE